MSCDTPCGEFKLLDLGHGKGVAGTSVVPTISSITKDGTNLIIRKTDGSQEHLSLAAGDEIRILNASGNKVLFKFNGV